MFRFISLRLILSGLLISGFTACSKSSDQNVIDEVDKALDALSQETPKCQSAIDILEKLGRQNKDPRYLQTLASAYACRGGFDELTLFNEVGSINSTFNLFLGSLAKISISSEAAADSDRFKDLQTAIDIILYAGSKTTPSALTQESIFGHRQGSNMNLQALYMILIQLGRFSRWYGNADATGVKGTGTSGSTCFMDYTDATAGVTATSQGGGNACTTTNAGHPNLRYATVTAAVAQKRLCQGVMLVNNLVDILANTQLSSNSSLGDISQIYADIKPYIDAAGLLHPQMPAFIAGPSQSSCQTTVAADDTVLQRYFGALFEGGML